MKSSIVRLLLLCTPFFLLNTTDLHGIRRRTPVQRFEEPPADEGWPSPRRIIREYQIAHLNERMRQLELMQARRCLMHLELDRGRGRDVTSTIEFFKRRIDELTGSRGEVSSMLAVTRSPSLRVLVVRHEQSLAQSTGWRVGCAQRTTSQRCSSCRCLIL